MHKVEVIVSDYTAKAYVFINSEDAKREVAKIEFSRYNDFRDGDEDEVITEAEFMSTYLKTETVESGVENGLVYVDDCNHYI